MKAAVFGAAVLAVGTVLAQAPVIRPFAPSASQLPGAAALRFGAPGAARFEDFASRPDATVIEGPNGKRTTVGEVKRVRQGKLAHRAAALRGQPLADRSSAPPPLDVSSPGPAHPIDLRQAGAVGLLGRPVIGSAQGCTAGGTSLPMLQFGGGPPCNNFTLFGSGFGSEKPTARLEGGFPGGPVPLEIGLHDNNRVHVLIATTVTGFRIQCAASLFDGVAPTPNARLVLRTASGHETSTEVCVVPRFESVAVAPPASLLQTAATPVQAAVSVQSGNLYVRRESYLEQAYGQDWGNTAGPPLNCFAPGQDTLTLPALPSASQFRWNVQITRGRTDRQPTAEGSGVDSTDFKGSYAIAQGGSPRAVDWGVWESLHRASPPEGDSKVCLSNYALTFYLYGPAGVALPPTPN